MHLSVLLTSIFVLLPCLYFSGRLRRLPPTNAKKCIRYNSADALNAGAFWKGRCRSFGVAKRSSSATTYRALPPPSPHRQLRPPARGSQGVSVRLVVWAVFADRRRFVGSRASAEL